VLSPVRFPPVLRPVVRNDPPYHNDQWRDLDPRLTDIAADDAVLLHTHYSTQWDSLAHRGALFDVDGDGEPEAVYYKGFRAGEGVVMDARQQVAAHGMQGRGVLVNLYRHFGESSRMESATTP
jgi:hypothetical protein